MKTGVIIGIVVLVLVILVVGGFLIKRTAPDMNSNGNTQESISGNSAGNTATVNAPSSSSAQTHSITISNFAFSPNTLTVSVGDKVIWTNGDSVPHTVTSDSGNELGSSTLSNGQTYSHTFSTAGTYTYHCSIHKMMTGTIIVQ